MKLSFDWVIGTVEIDISDCSVEDVNRLVELSGDDVQVNGTSLLIGTDKIEDVFRYLVPSCEVSLEWGEIPF